MPAPKEAVCASFTPGATRHFEKGQMDCGYVSGPFAQNGIGPLHIKGSKVRLADLIRELELILDRPILDETGFTGEFDLDLTFTPDATYGDFNPSGLTVPVWHQTLALPTSSPHWNNSSG